MLPIVHQIAKEFKLGLQNHYGDNLVELILFGSRARGDYHDESDIDFAIILRDSYLRSPEDRIKAAVIESDLLLKYGLVVSSSVASFEKKRSSMQGVYQDIRKEGIVI